MMQIRRADERGLAQHGWLDSRHTFSFADYHDPRFMGFGPLRVINEDRVQPSRGFGPHSHRDMEIISYVLDGALAHKDDIGNGSVLGAGAVQRMSAGTGVRHSEFNASQTDEVHFLQIWITPERMGLAPSYEERTYSDDEKGGRLLLVGARDGRDGAVVVHQDVDLYVAQLSAGDEVAHMARASRRLWIQVARGSLTVNGEQIGAGDGAALVHEERIVIAAHAGAELLLFDMA